MIGWLSSSKPCCFFRDDDDNPFLSSRDKKINRFCALGLDDQRRRCNTHKWRFHCRFLSSLCCNTWILSICVALDQVEQDWCDTSIISFIDLKVEQQQHHTHGRQAPWETGNTRLHRRRRERGGRRRRDTQRSQDGRRWAPNLTLKIITRNALKAARWMLNLILNEVQYLKSEYKGQIV